MMLLKSFFGRIIKDFRQKELWPIKLIFFTQMSTLFILYPYLTIHMRELGINVEETAIMSAIIPFVAIIMPPIAGLIADRIGNFKILLSFFSMLGGGAALLLLLVPVGRLNIQMPENVVLDVGCTHDVKENLVLTMSQNYPCDTLSYARLDLAVQSCGYACPVVGKNETYLKALIMSRNYEVHVHHPKTGKNESFNYLISESNMPEKLKIPEDLRESRKLKNLEFYRIAIRQLSKNFVFFPIHKPQLFEFSCKESDSVSDDNVTVCKFNLTSNSINEEKDLPKLQASVKALRSTDQDTDEQQQRYLVQGINWNNQGNKTSICSADDYQNEQVSVELKFTHSLINDENDEDLFVKDCIRKCILTAPRTNVCTNKKMVIEYDVSFTFWCYLCVRVFIAMIGGTAFAMFEGAVIAVLREHKADYGLQRIYGSIGGIISSPLSGLLIDYASRARGHTDFRPAFYLYAVLKIFSGFLMLLINLEFKAPAANVVNDVVSVLKNIEVVALLTACFVLGTAWGYIESFLFWLLEDLGASMSLMGMTITVGGITGIPLLALSGPLIDRLGHANVIFIGFIFYAVRLVGYSMITQPWQSLIFEALESVTSSLSFTAAVTYAAKLSSTSTDSSIQGLLGGLYYGVGKGSGSLIGGFLMKAFGTRATYLIFAAVTLITGFIYLLFNQLYLSKRLHIQDNNVINKNKPNNIEAETNKSSESQKEKEANEGIREQHYPYIVDDVEAINNARNLDIIETVVEQQQQQEGIHISSEDGNNHPRHRHHRNNGHVNVAFIADNEDDCQVIVEKAGPDRR
ncbi:uncharacterized protein LOC106638959 [Copidosoma floridanum]|uniref:uncharacterized protein LOC106638959 n=1 Tax=Copidosoma floridanum TaxID=29053 RepID=UPI0006C9DD36|nr:uncharacterized protein LOC106638959 [Copidosoma floridanum]XP_014207854.1 uncharacterized protein LOC106638959 [Copidosoma floridanum]